MYCTTLTWLFQYGIRRHVDGEFLSDFRRNKAVKFNSGQYMNNTLAPVGPILQGCRYQGIYGIL